MPVANESAEQNIIIVQDGEYDFFDNFTKKNGIAWPFKARKNSILSMSKSYVGYINTPKRTILLEPKYREIGFEHIVRIYLYVYGYRPTDSAAILDVSNSETSADVADMFIKNLKRNIQEGLIRTYSQKRVNMGSIRGRVDYTKTYMDARLMKRKYVSTKVSSLALNNDYNNLILSALKKLQPINKYSAVATELSMYFEGALSNVINGSAVLEKITFNSNTERYRRTLTYAAMIIDQLSYSDTGESVGTDSFLINFDKLFEDFIIKILKEIPEKKEFGTWSQKQKFAEVFDMMGKKGEREYQPDILFRFIAEDEKYDYSPSAYAVLDVKNKAYGQFKNADIYQILTYIKLLHSQKAILVYPSFKKKRPEVLSLDANIFNPSTVSACFINIADDSGDEFLKSIHWFVDVVVRIIMDISL